MYFDVNGGGIHVHTIRRGFVALTAYILLHLPLFASFTLASSAVGNLVTAHDCSDANVLDLAPTYIDNSKAQISQAWRWFYSPGLGVTLICMTLISMTHDHKALRSPRAGKDTRLVFRSAVALILIFLALAKDSLDSLDIIGITTALFACVLIFDIYGISCEGDNFWTGPNSDKEHTHYLAKTKLVKRVRRDLEEKLKRGEDVTL